MRICHLLYMKKELLYRASCISSMDFVSIYEQAMRCFVTILHKAHTKNAERSILYRVSWRSLICIKFSQKRKEHAESLIVSSRIVCNQCPDRNRPFFFIERIADKAFETFIIIAGLDCVIAETKPIACRQVPQGAETCIANVQTAVPLNFSEKIKYSAHTVPPVRIHFLECYRPAEARSISETGNP